ncbi:hypothetical protein EVAR_21054_1 [Eumeta japonica]|uniref:Uncharacterized protein n=1 Tax=Eumeta variegata TaxID=151549 RepID=A0A4C1UZW6_EUMVA|nr:hypothetical protein EVAR_21054_1 [Eumeta japonica]
MASPPAAPFGSIDATHSNPAASSVFIPFFVFKLPFMLSPIIKYSAALSLPYAVASANTQHLRSRSFNVLSRHYSHSHKLTSIWCPVLMFVRPGRLLVTSRQSRAQQCLYPIGESKLRIPLMPPINARATLSPHGATNDGFICFEVLLGGKCRLWFQLLVSTLAKRLPVLSRAMLMLPLLPSSDGRHGE